MKYTLRMIGAIILSVLIYVLLVLPGLHALASPASDADTSPALIAFAGNDQTLALSAETKLLDVDPSSLKPMRIFFGVDFGYSLVGHAPAPHAAYETTAVKRNSTVSAETTRGGDRNGVTVVLLGQLASGLKTCDDPSVMVSRKVTFASLTDAEKTSVVNYLTGTRSNQSEQAGVPSNATPYETPGDVAYGLTYTTLQPQVFYAAPHDPLSLTSDSNVTRTYNDYYNYFTCSFSRSAFWAKTGDERNFQFPEESLLSSGATDQSVARLERVVQSVSSVNSQLLSTEGSTASLSDGVNQVDDNSVIWDKAKPSTSTSAVSAQFSDTAASQQRERHIFLGGVGLSIVAGLVASMIKTFVVRFAPWLLGRVREWRSRRAASAAG